MLLGGTDLRGSRSTTYAAGSGWSTTTRTSSPRPSPRTSGSARPDADDDEVRAALDRACLGPWVDGLPDGIHTHVGAGRREVSGGERARLALARSLLADPPVLVLDEPTAHLDAATARAVADEMLDSAARVGTVDPLDHPRHGRAGRDGPGGAPRGGDGRLGQSACSRGERSGSVKVNVLP